MSLVQHHKVIKAPIATEKTMAMEADNVYTFKVASDANKTAIKNAVAAIFNVKVIDVKTVKVRGKAKRFRNKPGMTKGWKKAMVKLAENNTIDLAGLA